MMLERAWSSSQVISLVKRPHIGQTSLRVLRRRIVQLGADGLDKHMVWIAFAIHFLVYIALGIAIARLGARYLPEPFNELSTTVPLVLALGLLLILATLPFWHLL